MDHVDPNLFKIDKNIYNAQCIGNVEPIEFMIPYPSMRSLIEGQNIKYSKLNYNYDIDWRLKFLKFDYNIYHTNDVSLKIYDILGNEIYTVYSGTRTPGSYRATWRGVDNNNKPVASGVYLYQLVSGDNSITKKLLLNK